MNSKRKTVIYLRISSEDNDFNEYKFESDSISNQRDLALSFIKSKLATIVVVKHFCNTCG